MTARVIFRVDGGPIWGLSFGHVYRCLALANEFQGRRALPCSFVMKNYAEGVELVRAHGFPVEIIAVDAGWPEEAAAIGALVGKIVVFDLPRVDGRVLAPLRRSGVRTILVSDRVVPPQGADVMIAVSLAAGPNMDGSESGNGRVYAGPMYCILDSAFDIAPAVSIAPVAERILVTFGGSDPARLTEKAVAALRDFCREVQIDVILGPGFRSDLAIGDSGPNCGPRFVVHKNVEDILTMMTAADIVVAAGGRTAHELAAVGAPMVLIPSIEHETASTRALQDAGAAVDLGLWSENTGRLLRATVDRLIDDDGARRKMSVAGQRTVDGRGRSRVADLIAPN